MGPIVKLIMVNSTQSFCRTEWTPVQKVIIKMFNKIDDHRARV